MKNFIRVYKRRGDLNFEGLSSKESHFVFEIINKEIPWNPSVVLGRSEGIVEEGGNKRYCKIQFSSEIYARQWAVVLKKEIEKKLDEFCMIICDEDMVQIDMFYPLEDPGT